MIDRQSPQEPGSLNHSPAFQALSAMVDDAKRGEMRVPPKGRAAGGTASRQEAKAGGALPSSWYREPVADQQDFATDMMRAAGIGLGFGVVLLGTALVWTWSMQHAPPRPDFATGEWRVPLAASQSNEPDLKTNATPEQRMRAIIELARLRIVVGDITAARAALLRADVARDADALFLLAETYDANRLASWGAKSAEADAVRARALYAAANALGNPDADERLAALR